MPLHQSNLKGGGADMNLWGSNNNIRARGQIGRGGLVGQRAESMITLGSQYYDAEDASIDYEWAVVVAFE